MEIRLSVRDHDIRRAIEIRINKCFPAMRIAAELHAADSPPWKLLQQHSFADIMLEAHDRLLPYWEFVGSADGTPIAESAAFQKVQREFSGRNW